MAGDRDYQQDYIILGSEQSPGVCSIVNAASIRDWEQRKGYGLSGASTVYTGDSLSEFEIEFSIWDSADLNGAMFTKWYRFAQVLKKVPRGQRPRSLFIWHPFLAEIGISEVVVTNVGQFVQDRETGLFTKRVKFLEYRAPLPILAKPKGAIPNAADGGISAPTAAQAAILANNALIQSLAPPP